MGGQILRWARLALLGVLASCGGGGDSGPAPSSITVSPTTLDFHVLRGSPLPPPKAVRAAFSNGDGVLVGYPPGVEPASWLAVDNDLYEGTGVAEFWFYAIDTHPAGSLLTTTIRFVTGRADGSNISYVDMQVRLHIIEQIQPYEPSVSLVTEYPVEQHRQVWVDAPGLDWTAQSNQPWLQVAPGSVNGSGYLTLTTNTSGLVPGSHTATVTLEDENDHVETITVALTHRMPTMGTAFTGYSGSGTNGTTMAGGSASFALSNGTAAAWTASVNASWFVPTLSGSGGGRSLAYAIDPATPALASGTHSGTLTIRAVIDAGHEVVRTFPVSLVLTPATLSLSMSALELQGTVVDAGGYSLMASLDTGATSHPVTLSASSLNDWLVVDAAPATVSATAGTITGHANFGAVESGQYDGELTIVARVNGDTLARTVDVHMLREQWRLFAGDNGVALTSQPGVSRLSRNVEVIDTEGAGIEFTATSSEAWLSVSGAGTTPATLSLSADVANLAPGLYEATVTLAPQTEGADAGDQIRVGLYVATTPADARSIDSPYPWDIVTDPVRPYAYVITANGAGITAYNVYTGEAGASVTASQLEGLAISSDGGELYAYDRNAYTIAVYALPALTLKRTIANALELPPRQYGDLGYRSSFNYARPSGKPLLVTSRLGMLDPADGSVIYTRRAGTAPFPSLGDTVAVTGDSARAFLPGPFSIDLGYRWSDGAGNIDVGPSSDGPGGFAGTDVATNSDGTRVYGPTGNSYGSASFKLTNGFYKQQNVQQCRYTHPAGVETGLDGLWIGMCQDGSPDPQVRVLDENDQLLDSFFTDYTNRVSLMKVSGDGARMVWLTGQQDAAGGLRMRRMPDP